MSIKKINFGIYSCKKLKKIAEDINGIWEVESLKVSNFIIKNILKKLYKENTIKDGDISKLLVKIIEVKELLKSMKLGTIEDFFTKIAFLSEKDGKLKTLRSLDIFYDIFIVYFDNHIILKNSYNMVDEVLKNNSNFKSDYNNKTKYLLELKNSTEKYNLPEFFINHILNRDIDDLNDIAIKLELDYYIGRNLELFSKIIQYIFTKILSRIIMSKNLKLNISVKELYRNQIFSFNEKIEIFKIILNTYIDNNLTPNSIADIWFNEILEELGDIKRNTKNWESFNENQKNIFKKWYFTEKLDDFFGRRVKDPERLEFWKNYVHELQDIKFFNEISQAIVMEFEEHTMVEFGEKSNAAYMYPKHYFSVDIMDGIVRHNSVTEARRKSKNMPGAIPLKSTNLKPGWNHSGSWQQVFRYRLSNLGYRSK